MSNTMQTHNPTACCNLDCEHRPSCWRAALHDRHEPGTYQSSAYFSRDPRHANLRGWDCYWEVPSETRTP